MELSKLAIDIILYLQYTNIFPIELIYLIGNLYIDLYPKFTLVTFLCHKCDNCNKLNDIYNSIKSHILKTHPNIQFLKLNDKRSKNVLGYHKTGLTMYNLLTPNPFINNQKYMELHEILPGSQVMNMRYFCFNENRLGSYDFSCQFINIFNIHKPDDYVNWITACFRTSKFYRVLNI